MGFDLSFYELENGRKPAKEFVLGITDEKLRAKVLRALQILEEFGNGLREPDSKHLRNGIFELRVRQGNDIVRVLYFFYERRSIVVTSGFVKKSQKTPKTEVEKALKRKRDFEARSKL